jgi:chromosome segregation ATPase
VSPYIQRLSVLRQEADAAVARAEEAEAKNKKYEQEILHKDQDILSLQHKLSVLDAELEKAEAKIADHKVAREEGESTKNTAENLTRKIQLLEDELDTAEKNVKETMEKYVFSDILFIEIDGKLTWTFSTDSDKSMSKLSTLNAKCNALSRNEIYGRRSMRYDAPLSI